MNEVIKEIEMADKFHILMETRPDACDYNDIPVFAYAPGLRRSMEYEGNRVEFSDYCAVRDSRIHPSLWYETFGIEEYVYYTVEFK